MDLLAAWRPVIERDGIRIDLIAGQAGGMAGPAVTEWPISGAIITLDPGQRRDHLPAGPGPRVPVRAGLDVTIAGRAVSRIFPDMHVYSDPYPIQFGSGDWITVVTHATGTFTGEMTLPDGTVIPPTGKAFDVEFGQTTKWDGDQLIVISAFYDSALQRRQIGLA